MRRSTRISLVMAFALMTFAFGSPEPADAALAPKCEVPIAARYDYVSNMRVYACTSISSGTNLNVWNISCRSTSIFITISNATSYEWSRFDSQGRKYTVVGCRYDKQLAYVFGGSSCYVEATLSSRWYSGLGWVYVISPPRSNYC